MAAIQEIYKDFGYGTYETAVGVTASALSSALFLGGARLTQLRGHPLVGAPIPAAMGLSALAACVDAAAKPLFKKIFCDLVGEDYLAESLTFFATRAITVLLVVGAATAFGVAVQPILGSLTVNLLWGAMFECVSRDDTGLESPWCPPLYLII